MRKKKDFSGEICWYRDVSYCKMNRYVGKLLSITAGVHTYRTNLVYANNSKSKNKENKEIKYITEW